MDLKQSGANGSSSDKPPVLEEQREKVLIDSTNLSAFTICLDYISRWKKLNWAISF